MRLEYFFLSFECITLVLGEILEFYSSLAENDELFRPIGNFFAKKTWLWIHFLDLVNSEDWKKNTFELLTWELPEK